VVGLVRSRGAALQAAQAAVRREREGMGREGAVQEWEDRVRGCAAPGQEGAEAAAAAAAAAARGWEEPTALLRVAIDLVREICAPVPPPRSRVRAAPAATHAQASMS